MNPDRPDLCPRCEYRLIPVYAADRGRRRVVALSCPEPYCDHMQLVSRQESQLGRRHTPQKDDQRAAN